MTTALDSRIADAVVGAWHSHPYRDRTTIPFSAVATMTLLQTDSVATRSAILHFWRTCSDEAMITTVRQTWQALWILQPYLAYCARSLHEWITGDVHPDQEALDGFRECAVAALRAGLLDLTGSDDPRDRDSGDVLGAVLTRLRAPGDTRARGEYHTPADAAAALIGVTVTELPPVGASFDEPTAGTGGIFRVLAQHIRALGGDPADYQWSMTDLDQLAVAGAAVNAYLWGLGAPLGTNVLLYRANILTNANPHRLAIVERAHALAAHASALRVARLIAATHRGARLSGHHPTSGEHAA